MDEKFRLDLASVASIKAIPTMLDIVCRTTGMRFAAVARVTDARWITCAVRDDIAFGLKPGDELKVETTICHEIRQSKRAVIIDHVAEDPVYRDHHTPAMYGFQSYISVPIHLADGSMFGTLCAIDPAPHRLNTPETIAMFEMFADVIGFQLSAVRRVEQSEASLLDEKATSALREQFIAVLGHDLRNPLASIDGGLRLLVKTPLNERATNIVGMMQQSTRRMAGLIENVMDFARGRLGGGISLQRKPNIVIEELIRQVIGELQTGAPVRQITHAYAVPLALNVDPQRIGQLVSNLVGNALTYSPEDKPIQIAATVNDGWFEFSVSNQGEAIAPDVMDKIFQPFSRGAVRPSMQGLGLGLYISHEIARAHGGDLRVTSTPDETRFTFRMPVV